MRSLIETVYSALSRLNRVQLNHIHPVEMATAPDMVSRRASITFTAISNNNNMVLGAITYTFVTALGSPAASNVQVLIQGTLSDTVKKSAEAIRGVTDPSNIAYGTSTQPNPTCTGFWTSQRFSVGDTTVVPGQSLFLLERAEDIITALTLTSTATATINAFTRASWTKYVLDGNAAGTGGINSVRGSMHTVLPVGSIMLGGTPAPTGLVAYDCHAITICQQSETSEKELDIYVSDDEVTFTRYSRSIPLGDSSTSESLHKTIDIRGRRIPAGYGMFVRLGSSGTSASNNIDLKFSYHLYPHNLS